MLHFQLKQQILKRGNLNPSKWLIANGINSTSATRLLNGKQKSLKLSHLTDICVGLGCTPNDVLYWDKSQKRVHLAPEHPLLTQLKDPPNMADWKKIVKSMNADNAAKLHDIAQQLLAEEEAERKGGTD